MDETLVLSVDVDRTARSKWDETKSDYIKRAFLCLIIDNAGLLLLTLSLLFAHRLESDRSARLDSARFLTYSSSILFSAFADSGNSAEYSGLSWTL